MDPKDPKDPNPEAPNESTAARPAPPVTEREPLTVTVITPTAEPRVLEQPAQVEVPRRVEAWRGPSNLALLFAAMGVLLFTIYRMQFSPFILRLEHGLQRRVFGERTYEAHKQPQSRGGVGPGH